MDLKEFVSESLIEIFNGTKDAQTKIKEIGGEVNPMPTGDHSLLTKQGLFMAHEHNRKIGSYVEFDVAVTITEGTGKKVGIGIATGILGIGTTGQESRADTSLSRIKFKVPIVLP